MRLDVSDVSTPARGTLSVRQGDEGMVLEAEVYDGGARMDLSGLSAYLVGNFPGFIEAAMSVSDGVATVALDGSFAAKEGLYLPYVRLERGGNVIASTNGFRFRVERAADASAGDAEEFESFVGQMRQQYEAGIEQAHATAQQASQAAEAAAAQATQAVDDANTAVENANDATAAANAAAENANSAAQTVRTNILTGTLGPAVVASADDAHPGALMRKVQVLGQTRQNMWTNPSGTNNGVTVTSNGDGSMTLSGTATNTSTILVMTYALKLGTKYYLSVDKTIPGVGSGYGFYIDTDVQAAVCVGNSVASGVSYTPSAEASIVTLGLYIASGTTVSGTYRVMLNEGSTAEPWCPPGLSSVSELGVACAGRNLGTQATAYEPPTVTTTPQDLEGHELRSLPDGTRDVLTWNADGTRSIDEKLAEYTFDGTENWVLITNQPEMGHTFYTTFSRSLDRDKALEMMCDRLKVGSYIGDVNFSLNHPWTTGVYTGEDNSLDYIGIKTDDSISTVKQLKSWLSASPVTVIVAKLINSNITIDPVAMTEQPSTTLNVWADSDEGLSPEVEVTYERDLTLAYNDLASKVAALAVAQATN